MSPETNCPLSEIWRNPWGSVGRQYAKPLLPWKLWVSLIYVLVRVLQELGQFDLDLAPKSIMRKNLERVVFVTGDTAGVSPVNAVLDLMADTDKTPPPTGYRVNYAGEGEWKITVQVFRDLGVAFAGALVGIYILLVLQTSSFTMPLVIMVAIPLTMIGVMPGFALLNFLFTKPVQGFANPIYFTATAMIGMIALAGIVVRNSIILIDFIHHHLDRGYSSKEAVLRSGAVRFGPSCSRPWQPCSAPGSSPWTPSSRAWPGPSSSGSSPPPPSPWWWCR